MTPNAARRLVLYIEAAIASAELEGRRTRTAAHVAMAAGRNADPADAGVTAPAGCRDAREMRRAAEEAAALQSHTETQ